MLELPSQQELHSLFTGDFLNGELIHCARSGDKKWNAWNAKHAGTLAGTIGKNGYHIITICNRRYLAHRILWKLITGSEPQEIDHINGNRLDNRFSNLRECSHRQNGFNQSKHVNNVSGHKGVHWDARTGQWQVQIANPNGSNHLGRFNDLQEAVQAYQEAAEKLHGEFAKV